MWPKEEAPFIRSLLEFSSNVVDTSCHDVVSDSEIAFTSGWENIRPQAIYRSNRCNGRRKTKVASSPATRACQNVNNQSPKSSHVMRGTLDDSWNYHYPTADKAGNKTAAERETARDKIQEITTDAVKEINSNDQWEQEVHVQKLRDAIAALVKEPLSLHRTPVTSVDTLSQPSDKTAYRWAVDKPRIPHIGTQLMTQLRDRNKSTPGASTMPHHVQGLSLDCHDSSQPLNVRQLPVATCKEEQRAVRRHKVLDPTIRYELSQLVQSQLYNRLLVEKQSMNDQLLKVSSVLLLPSSSSSSSSAAQRSELHSSHSYPNISTGSRNCSFNGRTPLHKLSLYKRF